MLEKIVNVKYIAGIALIAATAVSPFVYSCGDDCAAAYGETEKGSYIQKNVDPANYNAHPGDDGCPSGCSSSSASCCWCPD